MTTDTTEAIARIIAGPLCDATKGEHSIAFQGTYRFCTQCGETIPKQRIGIVEALNKATAILSYLASRREAIANDDIADALERCDWSGAPIGNKAIIASAIERLRENVLFGQDAADHLALIDYISDKIGLPKDEELSRETFSAWLSASRRGAQEPVAYVDRDDLAELPYTQIDDTARLMIRDKDDQFAIPLYTAPPSPAPAGEVERMRGILAQCDHTLSVHGHIDADTPLHQRISAALNGVRHD